MYRITIDKSIDVTRTDSAVTARNVYGEATRIAKFEYQGKDHEVIYKQTFESINLPAIVKYLQMI